jgi:diguanylate cyclase (GGDEF)-like protein
MNDLLQSCETQEEAYRIIALTAGELFTGRSGCLSVLHSSGQYLETFARWGDDTLVEDVFPMEDCWALRRGHFHEVTDPKTSLLCAHFVRPPTHGYLCMPLTVQGETLGLFHLGAAPGAGEDAHSGQNQLAAAVAESIKLSLANLRLRKKLHEQATRDPLTGLFNRRYLEDTLPRELHRTLRRSTPLCVVMLDLDHFKQFNDTFGHDAGDLVLRESSRVLRENLRKSDIACRYGGEEFLLVLPDSSLADTSLRLEQIRLQFERMEIRHDGELLAAMTFSAGIAAAPEHGSTPEELLRAADDALYAAKQAGRNQILTYQPRG